MRLLLRRAVAAVLLAGVALSDAGAVRPLQPPAPPFPEPAAWVNSVPFTMQDFRGRKVVLVTFINAFSVNSIRTFGQLMRWWDRYALEGLMIVGIHTPDFDFDRDPLQVRKAIRRFGLPFPVLIDSRRLAWKAYENNAWPSHYLIDHRGNIIHDRIGEGGYNEFEKEIIGALDRLNGYTPPEDYLVPKDAEKADCGMLTPPFFLGSRRGKAFIRIHGKLLQTLTESRSGEVATAGDWRTEPEAVRYYGDATGMRDHLQLIYAGAEVMATISRFGNDPVKLFVKQDNLWMHSGNANSDVKWDDEDRSYVLVDEPRLYFLAKDKKKDRLRELQLIPERTGIGFSSFEFSDHCESDYLHH